ncbi:MAG: N-formylglutamate deformylase [Aquabacterium sp.]
MTHPIPAPTHPVCTLFKGSQPLLLSLPHVGTALPDWLKPRLTERALGTEDADWHLERLYDFVKASGASVLVPHYARYVVDLNRPPENTPMYPGVNNTELCPTRHFTGDPLYRDGQTPDAAEVQQRVQHYWRPYHDTLQAELARIRAAHGHAVLFDGHSILGELPWLFEGRLWDLNLGTVNGSSCAPALREALGRVLAAQDRYSHVTDGRFKGGHITRHYGCPGDGVHAVQLEMSFGCYMDEATPWGYRPERAAQVQPVLLALVQAMLDFRP